VEGFVLQLNYKWVAYVAVSRGAYDAQIFTNYREKLGAALGMMFRIAVPMRRR
jgi:hypothetical protein